MVNLMISFNMLKLVAYNSFFYGLTNVTVINYGVCRDGVEVYPDGTRTTKLIPMYIFIPVHKMNACEIHLLLVFWSF